MKLYRPVKINKINQYFGKDKTWSELLPFYQSLGLEGHNGLDYATPNGTPIYFGGTGHGLVEAIYWDYYGGNSLQIIVWGERTLRLVFYHLQEIKVKVGQVVDTADLLGYTNNSGAGTTGPHLHYEIKEVEVDDFGNFQTINKDNGYKGAIDPTQFDTGIFVVDYMDGLKAQIGIISKIIELLKKLLGKQKKF